MPNFRHRLPRARRQVYDQSNATSSIRLQATPNLYRAVHALPEALKTGEPGAVERVAQLIADEIAAALHVPTVKIHVSGQRPSDDRGELHGLYTAGPTAPAAIKLWMVTAKRGKVVAFKTFLRTLLHEICHHLDYVLLGLKDSMHTDGFYQRESSLFYQIGAVSAANKAVASEPQTRVPASDSR